MPPLPHSTKAGPLQHVLHSMCILLLFQPATWSLYANVWFSEWKTWLLHELSAKLTTDRWQMTWVSLFQDNLPYDVGRQSMYGAQFELEPLALSLISSKHSR